jgi:hypothetical protein
LAGAVSETAYSTTIRASGTGPIAFTVTAGALPAGLTLDPNTGVLSGTPTSSGSATFSITARNTAGTDMRAFTGSDLLPWATTGILTLLAGAVLLALAARRRLRTTLQGGWLGDAERD